MMRGVYNNKILGWVFKFWDGYLNFGAGFLKIIFFQCKKIKYEIN